MVRMKKFSKGLEAVGLWLSLILGPGAPDLLAQASPTNVNNQTATGDRPFASFMSADIDQVQINSGALDVRIPLAYLKGRGLDSDRFWIYTNKIWIYQEVPTGLPRPHDFNRFWTTVKQNPLTYVLDACLATHFIYTDRHGTKRPFNVQKVYGPQGCDVDKLTGSSLDATGMTIDISGLDSTAPIIVREKDGTQVNVNAYSGSFMRKDSNGNFTSLPGDGAAEMDTLGRELNHVTGQLPDGTQYEDWIVRDSNGTSQTTRIEFKSVTVSTNFQNPLTSEFNRPLPFFLAKKITLPNGLAYQFTYDEGSTPGHYGDLIRIDLPTGGYIRYEHVTISAGPDSSRGVSKRIVSLDGNPANEKTWTYGPQIPTGGNLASTVTDPDGNDSVHTFQDFGVYGPALYEVDVKYYQGSAATGTLLKSVHTDYVFTPVAGLDNSDIRPIRVTTTWPNSGALAKSLAVLQALQLLVGAYKEHQSLKTEMQTGYHFNSMTDLLEITNLNKAAENLPTGTPIQYGGLPGVPGTGAIFTLQENGQWVDKDGRILMQDEEGHFKIVGPFA